MLTIQPAQPLKSRVERRLNVVPAGMTIVPPCPQDLIAAAIAGTSSVDALPAEAGVQVARFLIDFEAASL